VAAHFRCLYVETRCPPNTPRSGTLTICSAHLPSAETSQGVVLKINYVALESHGIQEVEQVHKLLTAALAFIVLVSSCCTATTFRIDDKTCPLPPALSDTDKDQMVKFAGEVTGIAKGVAGVKLETELTNKVKETYPNAGDVNRIFALSYAACVACRLNPNSPSVCASSFQTVLANVAPKKAEAGKSSLEDAARYEEKVLNPLLK